MVLKFRTVCWKGCPWQLLFVLWFARWENYPWYRSCIQFIPTILWGYPTALITCRPTGGPRCRSHKNREDGTHLVETDGSLPSSYAVYRVSVVLKFRTVCWKGCPWQLLFVLWFARWENYPWYRSCIQFIPTILWGYPTALITCRPTGGPRCRSHKNRKDGTDLVETYGSLPSSYAMYRVRFQTICWKGHPRQLLFVLWFARWENCSCKTLKPTARSLPLMVCTESAWFWCSKQFAERAALGIFHLSFGLQVKGIVLVAAPAKPCEMEPIGWNWWLAPQLLRYVQSHRLITLALIWSTNLLMKNCSTFLLASKNL